MRPHPKYYLTLLLILQLVVLQILSWFPHAVERFYSNGVYPVMAKFWRFLLGWIPFSVGDVVYLILIVLLVRWFIKRRHTWRNQWRDNALQLVGFVSIGYLLFNLLWGLNYHRENLGVKLGLQDRTDTADTLAYSDAELMDFTLKLIGRINAQHLEITGDVDKKVVFEESWEQVLKSNAKGYDNLSEKFDFLRYETPSVKASLLSLPLTYMGFSGYLNPFTGEAHSNILGPRYQLPMIGCHEMAHQLGFASESEANFIGFLAATHHPDARYRFSGYATALVYCMGQWEVRNPETYEQLIKQINPGILENYRESREFWQAHETFIEDGFKWFYDNFLKLNQQEGLESYSRFVDLLVHYYKDRAL